MNAITTAVSFYDKYAQSWKQDSEYFNANGYYKWMANKLPESGIVLEIGCGLGYSTASLLNRRTPCCVN